MPDVLHCLQSLQQVRNVVEDVPPFPESRTARGSVSAAYRLSF